MYTKKFDDRSEKTIFTMFNWFKKKTANKKDFPEIIDKLLERLNGAQEAAIGSILRGIKEIDPKTKINPTTVNPKIIDTLYGYQITCVIGFLSTEKLIAFMDNLEFKDVLLEKIESSTEIKSNEIEFYNKKYLDCWGEIECLKKTFSKDIIELYKIPLKDKNIDKLIGMLGDTAVSVAYQSQMDGAMACGDRKLGIRLAKRFKKFLYEESYASSQKNEREIKHFEKKFK
jgi:hypothetical protein